MKVTVAISQTDVSTKEGAVVSLAGDAGLSSELYADFTTLLRSVPNPTETALDFLVVAGTVYALDRLVPRSAAADYWTRDFEVTVPVVDPAKWKRHSRTANECLGFLSGDRWKLEFSERKSPLVRRKRRKRRSSVRPRYASGTATCLFSGGLDSLVGAIDWLESHPGERLALAGHHDPGIAGPFSDQRGLLEGINEAYPGRLSPVLLGVGHSGRGPEITMRSRSILFIALGILVAGQIGDGTPLLIPENGTIALNVPLTPARRGSCSTRTAHPYYLELLQKWLSGIGLNHPLANPLLYKTKGEIVAECRNRLLLEKVFRGSVSCAKRGHTRTWINRSANGCGRCMPCIYRRAALHTAGLDDETYGRDICRGEVDWTDPKSEAVDDFRACLSFLRRNASPMEIAKMLVANGYLAPLDAIKHAGTVERAMDEIRRLIADKGTADVKRAAGIGGRSRRAN